MFNEQCSSYKMCFAKMLHTQNTGKLNLDFQVVYAELEKASRWQAFLRWKK